MSKPIQLSHTAIEKYNLCPRSYQIHYMENIKSTDIHSPLFFGKAIDEAINYLLLGKKENLTEDEKKILNESSTDDAFEKYMINYDLLGEVIDLRYYSQVRYNKSDIELDLIMTDHAIEDICLYACSTKIELNNRLQVNQFINECHDIRKAKQCMDKDTQKVYNFIAWKSLYFKGKWMIEAYKENILPRIKVVHSIQKKVELPDEEGNMLIGYVDFEATFDDGIRYIIDNKTASKSYTEKNFDSNQLVIYSEYLDNLNVGYAVMLKEVYKKYPNFKTQLLFHKVDPEIKVAVFQNIEHTLQDIKKSEFPENRKNCFQYGKKCAYYEFCRSEGENMVGLKKVVK